jgi:flagellar assembly protein FliH
MSSSSTRTGLLRVFRDDATSDTRLALARWQPTPLSDVEGPGPRVDPFESARQTGYEEGYLAARTESQTASASATETDRRRVRSALADAAAAVATTRVEAVTTLTTEVVELALELAQAFLQRELTLSDSIDVEAVARALGLAPAGEDLVVRLHPDHAVEVAHIEALAPGVSVKVIEDMAIERGGCVLEVGPCRIDTQIGPAIERARAVLAATVTAEENQL